MINFKNYSQLWVEEPDCLIDRLKSLPDFSVIVEIGTANGGTTGIIYEATKNKNNQIYSIDIISSQVAKKILRNTNIKLINGTSEEVAKSWYEGDRNSIDFLYIDGDHSFIGIYNDFFSWIPNLNTDALLTFHDYDPDIRGGVAHLGVKIFLDTLIQNKILIHFDHTYRFLFCNLSDRNRKHMPVKIFTETFIKLGYFIQNNIRILVQENDNGLEKFHNHYLNSLQSCYYIEYLINNEPRIIFEYAQIKPEILHWLEMYNMLIHGFGEAMYPWRSDELKAITTKKMLSAIIAREQLKLNILIRILKCIVDWEP